MRLIFVGSTESANTNTKRYILFTKARKNTQWHNGHGIYPWQLVETTEKVKTLGFHIQTINLPIMNANYYMRFIRNFPTITTPRP
jgi:hypothetical protein